MSTALKIILVLLLAALIIFASGVMGYICNQVITNSILRHLSCGAIGLENGLFGGIIMVNIINC